MVGTTRLQVSVNQCVDQDINRINQASASSGHSSNSLNSATTSALRRSLVNHVRFSPSSGSSASVLATEQGIHRVRLKLWISCQKEQRAVFTSPVDEILQGRRYGSPNRNVLPAMRWVVVQNPAEGMVCEMRTPHQRWIGDIGIKLHLFIRQGPRQAIGVGCQKLSDFIR